MFYLKVLIAVIWVDDIYQKVIIIYLALISFHFLKEGAYYHINTLHSGVI